MNTHSHRGSTSEGAERSPGGSMKKVCVYDSAVYFIRDEATKKEVMMWGDVEPDSLSLSPRNHPAWHEAATRFHNGLLDTIFIECSFDCCQPDQALFGHLSPQHLSRELQIMADKVVGLKAQEEKERREKLKRKRMSLSIENISKKHPIQFPGDGGMSHDRDDISDSSDSEHQNGYGNCNGGGNERRHSKGSRYMGPEDNDHDQDHLSPLSHGALTNGKAGHEHDFFSLTVGQRTPEPRVPLEAHPHPCPASISAGLLERGPLVGLHLVVTHVKDTLEDDVDVAENILASLERLEKDKRLGCTFSLSKQGGTFYF